MVKKLYKRYREAFRIQVVRKFEQDAISLNALHQRYDMTMATRQKWRH